MRAGPIAATRERNPAVSTTNAQPPRADAGPKADVALDLRDLRRVFLPRNNVPVEALAGVSLSVRHGEVVAILGKRDHALAGGVLEQLRRPADDEAALRADRHNCHTHRVREKTPVELVSFEG